MVIAAVPDGTSRLVEALVQVCRQRLLDEKWLLGPSLRIGRQWAEQAARSGGQAINLHIQTTRRLALDLAEASVGDRYQFLPELGATVLLDRLLDRLRQAGSPYLTTLRPSLA